MYILSILSYTGLIILFINTIIYLIGFTGKGKAYRFFMYYLVCIFVIQTVNLIYSELNLNNHFLSLYYIFSQFIFLSCFFYHLFKDVNDKSKKIVLYSSVLVNAGLLLHYIIKPELYYTFNSLGMLITNCVIVVYSAMYFYELLSDKLQFHYANIGILTYQMSSVLIFASFSSVVSFNVEISTFIWKINALLFIVYQLLILWEWKQTFYQKATK